MHVYYNKTWLLNPSLKLLRDILTLWPHEDIIHKGIRENLFYSGVNKRLLFMIIYEYYKWNINTCSNLQQTHYSGYKVRYPKYIFKPE